MQIINKEVLLLKAQSDDQNDKYESLLIKNGFTVKHLQILSFNYCNLTSIKEKLNNVNVYDGVIFTSPRAVLAVKLSLNNDNIKKAWNDKYNYVVGETTYDLAQKEIGIICHGRETGNANKLADLIIKDSSTKNFKQFLFPCGNLKKESLVKCLNQNNIKVDATTIYETVSNANLTNDFKIVTSNYKNISEYIVYFSPSGVKFTKDIFKEVGISLAKLKLIAIGPSTEEALKFEDLPVYSVAAKPTETELLNSILK